MKINIDAVLADEARRKAEVKPLPVVQFVSTQRTEKIPARAKVLAKQVDEKEMVLSDLWGECTKIKKERAKLSTKTSSIVDNIAKALGKEGTGVVKAFLAGDIPVPALKEHYAQIQQRTDKLKSLHDKITYVEQFGSIPSERPLVTLPDDEGKDAKAIHYEIRRLDDLVHKTRKKMAAAKSGLKQPKNSDRFERWTIKIALAEAKRDELKKHLSRTRYESREQRISA
jgi:hypothetical protein